MKDNIKDISNKLIDSSEYIKELHNEKYEISDLFIVPIDGCLPLLNKGEDARLILYQQITGIGENSNKNQKVNRCIIEARISLSNLKKLLEILIFEINSIEEDQNKKTIVNFETKRNEVMYG